MLAIERSIQTGDRRRVTILPKNQRPGAGGADHADYADHTDQAQQAEDCQLHDGIPRHARCCVYAGHEPPCVAAAAHVLYGASAVVITLPEDRESRRTKQRHALAIGASTLESIGFENSAQLLRARIAAMRCELPPILGESDATPLTEALHGAISESAAADDDASMAAHLVFGPAAVVITMPGDIDALRAEQRGALAFSARVLEAFGHSHGAAALRATPPLSRSRSALGTMPIVPEAQEDYDNEDDAETKIFDVPLSDDCSRPPSPRRG